MNLVYLMMVVFVVVRYRWMIVMVILEIPLFYLLGGESWSSDSVNTSGVATAILNCIIWGLCFSDWAVEQRQRFKSLPNGTNPYKLIEETERMLGELRSLGQDTTETQLKLSKLKAELATTTIRPDYWKIDPTDLRLWIHFFKKFTLLAGLGVGGFLIILWAVMRNMP